MYPRKAGKPNKGEQIDYSDASTRAVGSGCGPSLGMGSRGTGSLRLSIKLGARGTVSRTAVLLPDLSEPFALLSEATSRLPFVVPGLPLAASSPLGVALP
jgi:hypothetical protein